VEAHTRKLHTRGVGISNRRHTPRQPLHIVRDVGIREGIVAIGVTQGDIFNDSAGSQTSKGTTRQTTLHMWGTIPTLNINNLKASTQLLDLEDRNSTQEEKYRKYDKIELQKCKQPTMAASPLVLLANSWAPRLRI